MYTPDRWVIVEFSYPTETIQKVFAGWYGGFAGSDSWKLNSGITEVRKVGDTFEFDGYSGSTYKCHKDCYGMSFYMSSIFQNWMSMSEAEASDIKIRILDLEDIKVS